MKEPILADETALLTFWMHLAASFCSHCEAWLDVGAFFVLFWCRLMFTSSCAGASGTLSISRTPWPWPGGVTIRTCCGNQVDCLTSAWRGSASMQLQTPGGYKDAVLVIVSGQISTNSKGEAHGKYKSTRKVLSPQISSQGQSHRPIYTR